MLNTQSIVQYHTYLYNMALQINYTSIKNKKKLHQQANDQLCQKISEYNNLCLYNLCLWSIKLILTKQKLSNTRTLVNNKDNLT